MRIAYVTHTRFPVQKAHGKQIAEVCSALAALKHKVTLLCPSVFNSIPVDGFSYYGLKRTFKVEYLGHTDATLQWWVPGILHFAVNMRRYRKAFRSYFAQHRFDLLYVRSPFLLATLLKTGIPVVLELHALPRFGVKKLARMSRGCARVVCLTSLMRSAFIAAGANPKRVVVEADGVDLKQFTPLHDSQAAKKRWGLPKTVPVIGYVGSFVTRKSLEKGVGVLLEGLQHLVRSHRKFHGWIVGGPENWRRRYEIRARQMGIDDCVHFKGQIPGPLVPEALAACDILVYPAPASKHPYFQRDTSPLKLFEYLASGKPIVCADLPPLRDVVDEKTVYLFTPGDPGSLSGWLEHVLKHPKEAQAKAKRGLTLVKNYAWEKRMERILRGL